MFQKSLLIKGFTMFIRAIGIGSRFLLTFLITKHISLEFQGEYTLISTTVSLLVILFGLDFYVYANRLIVKNTLQEIFCLKNGLVFYFLSYILLMPLLWLVFNWFSIEVVPFWLLALVIVFEHMGQEFFRTYIALKNPLLANIFLFIRTGFWAMLVVLGFVFVPGFNISIEGILSLWLGCAVVSCFFGFYFFPEINQFFNIKIDWSWIRKGLLVGATMFASTICLKIIEYSDRYLIAFFMDKKSLGIYALFFQMANLVNVIIFTMYISFVYPDIIKSVYDRRIDRLKIAQRTIINKTLLIILFYVLASVVFMPFVLDFMGKKELYDYIYVFYIIILSSLFLNLSFASHFVLVGEENEKLVFKVTFVACLLNIACNVILIPLLGIYGSATALLLSNLALFVGKRRFEKKLLLKWK